jgi:multiple sugar transport system permease protein
MQTIRGREKRTALILLLPALLMLLFVFGYPIARAFWLSFFTQNLGTKLQPVFSGFDNYARMAGDGRFWQSFWTTSIFTTVTVFLELILGMGVALILNQRFFWTRCSADDRYFTLGFTNSFDWSSLGVDF